MQNEKIKKLFENKLNVQNIKVVGEEKGIHSVVRIVQSDDKKYIVKFSVWPVKAFREKFAYQKLFGLIPMPHLLVSGQDYVIQDYVEGKFLDEVRLSEQEIRKIYIELGRILKRIHQIKTAGAGFIETDGKGGHKSFKDFVNSWLDDHLDILRKSNLVSKKNFSKLQKYIDDQKDFLRVEDYRLLHYDLEEWNVKIKGKKIIAIIDFGDLFSGPIEWDFARSYLTHYFEGRFNYLIEGYGNKVDLEKVKYYAVLEILFTFPYNHNNNKLKLDHQLKILRDILQF